MSSLSSDENENENYYNCSILLHSLNTSDYRHDSGYFSSSSESQQQTSDDENSSPIRTISRRFPTTKDYDEYVTKRKHFDILSQLDYQNISHLIDKILWQLSTKDLHSCSKVSRKWNSILKDFQLRDKMKRNFFTIHHQHRKKINLLNNTPMQNVTNLLDIPPSQIESNGTTETNFHLVASSMTCRYKYLKYLHGPTIPKRCPICAYVSIVDVNDQHGICTNSLCENHFCQSCSGPYHHPSTPCKTTTGPIQSPWRSRPNLSPIFSRKTRTNLRRLLIR